MAKLIDPTDKYYRERINRQYDRGSGPEERLLYYPQTVSYMANSRHDKGSQPEYKKRSCSRKREENELVPLTDQPPPKPKDDDTFDDTKNGVMEGIETLLRTKSKSKHCDAFGNQVNKIDYAIYDGKEFQQDKSDTKSLFQRVDERDESGKTTVVSLASPKKNKKLSKKSQKRDTYNPPLLSPGSYVDDEEEKKKHIIHDVCKDTNKQNREENEIEEATKTLIDGPKTTNNIEKGFGDSNQNINDSPINAIVNTKKLTHYLKTGRQESPIEAKRDRVKSPRKAHITPAASERCGNGDCSDIPAKVPLQIESEDQQNTVKNVKTIASQDLNSNRGDFDPISDLPDRVKKKKKRSKKRKRKDLFELGNNPDRIRYESDSDEERRRRKREKKRERRKEMESNSNIPPPPTKPISPHHAIVNEPVLSDADILTCSEGSVSLGSDASSSDVSLKTEEQKCHRSKSESSVCESVSVRPKKQFNITERQPRPFGGGDMFRSDRSMSEGRGLFNKLSQVSDFVIKFKQ